MEISEARNQIRLCTLALLTELEFSGDTFLSWVLALIDAKEVLTVREMSEFVESLGKGVIEAAGERKVVVLRYVDETK